MCWLLVWQFFSLFAQFKTTTKSHGNYVFLYSFSRMAISPQNNEETVFYTGKLYGLTGMIYIYIYVCVCGYKVTITRWQPYKSWATLTMWIMCANIDLVRLHFSSWWSIVVKGRFDQFEEFTHTQTYKLIVCTIVTSLAADLDFTRPGQSS